MYFYDNILINVINVKKCHKQKSIYYIMIIFVQLDNQQRLLLVWCSGSISVV